MKRNLCFLMIMVLLSFACSKADDQTVRSDLKSKIINITGKGEVIRNNTTEPAKLNMILSKGDIIRTYDGTVDLRIIGLGVAKIKPNSFVEIFSIVAKSDLTVKKGRILIALNKLKKGDAFTVGTPTAVVGVRGTSFLINVAQKDTRVGVLTGVVKVKSSKGEIEVNELREVSVSDTKLEDVSEMDITTIVEVKDMLKIKEIDTVDEYTRIKANIKKLEIIESSENAAGIDMDSLKRSINVKGVEEEGSVMSDELKKKSSEVKSSSVDATKKQFLDDKEF